MSRSGIQSASQETRNENFMVTINPPFVFEVLTLHGHVPRCDCFGKHLDCFITGVLKEQR